MLVDCFLLKNINSRLHLGMEHLRNIMEIMENDEMFPTKTEWAYVEISNELKHLHLKLKELTGQTATTATIDPSAPPRVIRDAWRDLNSLRVRPRR
jgi:hypothetical protein|tara:strand:+ start:549 stop:836 length:288 start_codon:yes stop_codon:yes gene_type:complete